MSNLKTIYFGTPVFSKTILQGLLDLGVDVVAVVTREDKPGKRSKELIPSPVKVLARKEGIPLLQPSKASDPAFIEQLKGFQADIFLVAAYGAILKQQVLDIPKYGCYNLHAGLLPAFRGAAPIQRCIMAGCTKSGNTVIRMDAGMDTGDIALRTFVDISPDMTAGDLAIELAEGGAKALHQVMLSIEDGSLVLEKQDDSLATMASKLLKSEGALPWDKDCLQVYNHFRGVTPSPGAWVMVSIKGGAPKKLSILDARPIQKTFSQKPGRIVSESKKDLIISCGEGGLALFRVKLEGRVEMGIKDFLNGVSISDLEVGFH